LGWIVALQARRPATLRRSVWPIEGLSMGFLGRPSLGGIVEDGRFSRVLRARHALERPTCGCAAVLIFGLEECYLLPRQANEFISDGDAAAEQHAQDQEATARWSRCVWPLRSRSRPGASGRLRYGLPDRLADPVCGFQAVRRSANRSEPRPRWQGSTARVWLRSLRCQRDHRCQASRAQTRLAW